MRAAGDLIGASAARPPSGGDMFDSDGVGGVWRAIGADGKSIGRRMGIGSEAAGSEAVVRRGRWRGEAGS